MLLRKHLKFYLLVSYTKLRLLLYGPGVSAYVAILLLLFIVFTRLPVYARGIFELSRR